MTTRIQGCTVHPHTHIESVLFRHPDRIEVAYATPEGHRCHADLEWRDGGAARLIWSTEEAVRITWAGF